MNKKKMNEYITPPHPTPPHPTPTMEVQEKWQQRSMNEPMEKQENSSVAWTLLPHPTPPHPTPPHPIVLYLTWQKHAKRWFGFQPVRINIFKRP